MQTTTKLFFGLFICLITAPVYAFGLDWSHGQQNSLFQGAINATLLPKHALPTLIVGFWALQRGGSERWFLSAAWLIGIGAAALISTTSAPIGGDLLQMMLMVSLFVLGLIVAFPIKMNMGMAGIIALFFAAIHGFSIAEEAPRQAILSLYALGTVGGGAAIIGIATFIAALVKDKVPMLPQISGAAAAGMGLAVIFSLQRFFV